MFDYYIWIFSAPPKLDYWCVNSTIEKIQREPIPGNQYREITTSETDTPR